MIKLQYLTLATAITILGLNIKTIDANASAIESRTNLAQSNGSASYRIAQKSSDRKKSSTSEDMEAIETIQKRDRKIQGFKDMLKIDGIVLEVDEDAENSVDTGDDMMNAIQKRQQKMENLKELKILKAKYNQEKIKELAKENINLKDAEEFEELQSIINNESLNSDEILKALEKQNINIKSVDKLNKIQKIINTGKPKSLSSKTDDSDKLSATTAFRMFTIGIPATILLFFIATPLVKGSFAAFKTNYDKKFGKPKVPDGSITLHNKALKEKLYHQ